MKAYDIVGYTRDAEVICTDCNGHMNESADFNPIFASEEGWESHVCDSCKNTLGDVEGVEPDDEDDDGPQDYE